MASWLLITHEELCWTRTANRREVVVDNACCRSSLAIFFSRLGSRTYTALPAFESGENGVIGQFDYEIEDVFTGTIAQADQNAIVSSSPIVDKIIKPTALIKFKKFTEVTNVSTSERFSPRHSPLAAGSFVLPKPPLADSSNVIEVVVDPLLARMLKGHQKIGVKFLYESVMGWKEPPFQGAILADEMGLGKSLQIIVLVWTLLKQTPLAGASNIAKKVMVACPATLLGHWKAEFEKWLGKTRIRANEREDITDFERGRVHDVMLISYDRARTCKDLLQGLSVNLLVCDEGVIANSGTTEVLLTNEEGHRLKNPKSQAYEALNILQTRKRIIVTGTPIQNCLMEVHALVDFVSPGILGSAKTFQDQFGAHIGNLQELDRSAPETEKGSEILEELRKRMQSFMLRRTVADIASELPEKKEFTLVCEMTETQCTEYKAALEEAEPTKSLDAAESSKPNILQFLGNLRQIASCAKITEDGPSKLAVSGNLFYLYHQSDLFSLHTGKIIVLRNLVANIRKTTSEKVVLVSHWTNSLDLMEKLCIQQNWPFLRIDGQTPPSERQPLVDLFNSSPSHFIFLLSIKAGGTGLNLTGASRMVIFDLDWNPSHFQQVKARIWRLGQERKVFVYTLLAAGTIDEMLYKTQARKLRLSDAVLDDGFMESTSQNDISELRAIRNFKTSILAAAGAFGEGHYDLTLKVGEAGSRATHKTLMSMDSHLGTSLDRVLHIISQSY
ncbi:SNF2 family N-terminal domain-containing protein [Phlyctochytrium arcticum]|nr:SNF2 family N-terminal domain-containing protein [Phlyctochytrium arcticum]